MATLIDLASSIVRAVINKMHSSDYDVRLEVTEELGSKGELFTEGQVKIVFNALVEQGLVIADLDEGIYKIADLPVFGFHVNKNTTLDERKITLATVSADPPVSLHQFYSVAEAKVLLQQLIVAIAQAEVSKDEV